MNQPLKAKLLLVEDDENLSLVIKDYLALEGYSVTVCGNGNEGWDKYISESHDLCILDIMMPELDGFTLAEKIRQQNDKIPILFLTAKTAQEDKIRGFKIGADDYIVKPFNIEELLLRIEVFLKRINVKTNSKNLYIIGNYKFDFPNLTLEDEKNSQKLTRREAEILKLLVQNMNKLVKRDDILMQLWGNNDYFLGRSLDVFVSKLRRYLGNDKSIKITNYHSVGFKLEIK
jgi:DNA-binding response OmpR family regulator